MNTCEHCGANLEDGAKFCPYCGCGTGVKEKKAEEPLPPMEEYHPESTVISDEKVEGPSKVSMVMGILSVIFGLIALVSYFISTFFMGVINEALSDGTNGSADPLITVFKTFLSLDSGIFSIGGIIFGIIGTTKKGGIIAGRILAAIGLLISLTSGILTVVNIF